MVYIESTRKGEHIDDQWVEELLSRVSRIIDDHPFISGLLTAEYTMHLRELAEAMGLKIREPDWEAELLDGEVVK